MLPCRQRPPILSFRPRARRGSVLIAVFVGFLVFMGAYVAFATAQTNHARRLSADYGKLQAIYAAESAVLEAFVRNANVATTTLWSDAANNKATYSATRDAAIAPTWITGTGTMVFRGETYTATVRGYHVGNQIMQWDFGK